MIMILTKQTMMGKEEGVRNKAPGWMHTSKTKKGARAYTWHGMT